MGRLGRRRGKDNLYGVAGNVEFYTVGERTYFKSHAKKHKKSKSKKAVTGRNNFKSIVNLAREIITIPDLKEIWNRSPLQGRNAYQKLIKHNMPLAYDGNLTIKNFITPRGQKLYLPDFSLDDDTLRFDFDLYGLIKPPLTLHMFYYLYNYKIPSGFYFNYKYYPIHITPDNADTMRKKGDSKYTIHRKLYSNEISTLSYWKDVVVLLAVTGTPSIAGRKYWTNTVGFDIPLI